ncbi:MAG TPA: substrate-binding domain-containing protein [Candidatus Limnocylindria bacterium]|nr:substrate-binding domain-containing protein [Candidatus Limnocylindria bacterium]
MKALIRRRIRFGAGLVDWMLAGFLLLILPGCSPSGGEERTVVVYCAQDQIVAEPILAEFTKQTQIAVKALYDSEATKTVGLANRLLAEKERPRCDLFWGNEELRVRQLGARGIWRETNGWVAFGQRSRCLVRNSKLLSEAEAPHSLVELTNRQWSGKVSVAYPMFGTTSTHFLALRQAWGDAAWREWMTGLAKNHPFIEEGNSWVVQRLGRGEALVGITDTDDALAAQREGLPIAIIETHQAMLAIPNTLGWVKGGPHEKEADALAIYLQSPTVVARLVETGALQAGNILPVGSGWLKPDWDALVRDLDASSAELQRIFAR